MLDPRTPVIVGVGQLSLAKDERAPEPIDMMVEAVRRAEADSGSARLVAATGSVRVVPIVCWHYRDPARLLAERLGVADAQSALGTVGGNIVGTLISRTATAIQAGDLDVAVVAGVEAWRTTTASRRGDAPLDWTVQPDSITPDLVIGEHMEMVHPAELARQVVLPATMYPIFENAYRAHHHIAIADHVAMIGRMWARFSEVAAANPYANDRKVRTPSQIVDPSPENRMVSFPYTKLLCSNQVVDQSAAVIMCSVERARALGVASDRWVFPLVAAEAAAPQVSERLDLWSAPAVRAAGRALWQQAAIGPDDVAHVDLYSCFPSAVVIQAEELGLDLDRELTLTGGMRFAGGPWNNYAMHAVAAMVERLRDDAGAVGLCTANGGHLTKQVTSLYSTTPRPGGFVGVSAQREVDALERRAVDTAPDGHAVIESYTVMHDREAPVRAVLACLDATGRRSWASVTEPEAMRAMMVDDPIGRAVFLQPDGTASLE